MKNKILKLCWAMVFLMAIASIFIVANVSAEIYSTESVIINNVSSTATLKGFYRYDDTSPNGYGNYVPMDLYFNYIITDLPYELSTGIDNYKIDWCSLNYTHFKNGIYWFNITSNRTFSQSHMFTTGSAVYNNAHIGQIYATDSVDFSITCHYNDSRYVYYGNEFGADFIAVEPSYVCLECQQYDYGVVVNNSIARQQSQFGLYNNIMTIVSFNWKIWLILEWIVRIMFIFISIGLIFAGIYWIYVFISNIEKEIK